MKRNEDTELWEEVTDEVARKKVGHSFRTEKKMNSTKSRRNDEAARRKENRSERRPSEPVLSFVGGAGQEPMTTQNWWRISGNEDLDSIDSPH